MAEVRAVPVMDRADPVGRGRHVHVQVRRGLADLGRTEFVDVVLGPVQAVLLAAPEREPDPVGRGDPGLLHPPRGLQDRRDPAAVVINARALLHGVQMRAHHHGVPGTAPGVGEDVKGLHRLAAPAVLFEREALPHRRVPGRAQLFLDVAGRLLIPRGPRGPVPAVGIRHPLQRLQVPHHVPGLERRQHGTRIHRARRGQLRNCSTRSGGLGCGGLARAAAGFARGAT